MRKALTAALTTAALTTAAALATLAMTLPANAATTPPQSAPHKNASGHAVMRGGKILSTVKSTDSHGDTTYTTTTTAGTIKVEIARPGSGMIPQPASGCVGNNLWNNVQTCFAINGSGYYVNYMSTSAYVRSTGITAENVIDGPSVYFHSAFYYIAPGDVLYSRIDLNKNVKGGKYCGETEGLSGYNYGTACETVS